MISLTLLAAAAAAAAAAPAALGTTPPNVLIVLTDDQGWGDTGYNCGQPVLAHSDAHAQPLLSLSTGSRGRMPAAHQQLQLAQLVNSSG